MLNLIAIDHNNPGLSLNLRLTIYSDDQQRFSPNLYEKLTKVSL